MEADRSLSGSGITPETRPAAKKPARMCARRRDDASPSAGMGPAPTQPKDEIMEEQIKAATDHVQAQAGAMFADAGARAQGAVERGTKLFAEMGEFSKGNLDAVAESGRIAARGLEAMGHDAANFARSSYENSVAALRSLSSVKSPTELLQAQGELVRKAFDAMVAQTSRNTETTLKLAGEIAQPLQNRWALAAEKARTTA
jgi:phasin family protein